MDNVRTLRSRLGITQSELATLLGLNQSTISRLEKGTLPLDERTRLALEALEARHARPTADDPPPPFPNPPQGADLPAKAQPGPAPEKHARIVPDGCASSSTKSPTRSSASVNASGEKVAA